jgi:hypothetical protein
MRKPPGSLDAWGAYQRGLWHLGKVTADDNAVAQKFFQQAIDLDPNFAGGYWGLASAQIGAIAIEETSSGVNPNIRATSPAAIMVPSDPASRPAPAGTRCRKKV